MLTAMVLAMCVDGPQVRVAEGRLQGVEEGGLRVFRGVRFAAPPVGEGRWKAPQPAAKWEGARDATAFGPRPMQLPIYSDMMFRSPSVGEDCLTLNVWAPTKGRRLPVLVYFYGGGFSAGAADEKRYDGASMARRGIVSITVNYRLGVFGFLAHPELSKETGRGSGNYGLMDQAAALRWVHKNVGAFGGDPKRVTIAGESAGSFSVSAQMASPLAKGLIAGAIGESGSLVGSARTMPLEVAERNGLAFGTSIGAPTLAALRAMPAELLLDKARNGRFGPVVDGVFFPKDPTAIYAAGEQAHVPLLAGWNAAEGGSVLQRGEPATREGFGRALERLYPGRGEAALAAYAPTPDVDVEQAAVDLGGDRFIGFGTWKWIDLHGRTGGRPTYRYFYVQPRPGSVASHSAEIEYALGNLDLNPAYAWTADDRKTSTAMQAYFENFVKRGDPNGPGLPVWTDARKGATQRLGPAPESAIEWRETRYRFLDSLLPGAR